jgi:hypothetical protein
MIGEKDALIGVHNDIALPVVVFTAVAACFFVGIFQIAIGAPRTWGVYAGT